MSSYDKVVKLACKPKAAPPKAKYLDPIIAATWSEDGAVHDVCKALSPRFREPNAIVVFKALIVLHTMIRNGATDNVLSYLSSSEVLRLQNVSAGNWEGYAAPQNLQNYAIYLDSRIRAYHDLKHDAVRVQAESNRDMRNSLSIEEDGYRSRKGNNKSATTGPTRSKTITGRKLRSMTVEKGLLRETKAVHRMVDSLVECRFYLDDLEDELTTTALRMLVKDLLILFQAGNEGVINVLEHYFEMSHVDAEQALAIYRRFCSQTERVVEFLGVAKKLQNLLNVPIPHLKHAPVSLAGALQEYLDDPSFEQNRIEYKTNKEAVDRPGKKTASSTTKNAPKASSPAASTSKETKPAATAGSSTTPNANNKNQDVIDFFSAIESENQTNNPQINNPNAAFFPQQGAPNPFFQGQMSTGQPFIQQGQVAPQATGYMIPQQTAFQPFSQHPSGINPQQDQQTGHRPFASFLPTQGTSFMQANPQQQQQQPQQTGFLQAQATGSNPFRQSVLVPQTTGMALFGTGMSLQGSFTGQNPPQQGPGGSPMPTSQSHGSPFAQPSSFGSTSPSGMPARPASTPLTSFGSTPVAVASPPQAQTIKTHQTGTKNPFGRVMTPPPAVPRQPTLMELATGANIHSGSNGTQGGQQQFQSQFQQQQPQQTQQRPQQTGGTNGFSFNSSSLNPGSTDISSIASSFAFNQNGNSNSKPDTSSFSTSSSPNPQNTATTTSAFATSAFSSSFSAQPTGTSTSPSMAATTALKPQMTGFGGIKPFKPSSSFGASLLESLPPIPGSSPTTPVIAGNSPGISNQYSSQPTGSSAQQLTGFGAFNSQPTGANVRNFSGGSSLGQGLRPQMTGGGANPFRASMVDNSTGGNPNFGGNTSFSSNSLSSGFSPTSSFGANLFAGSGGTFGQGYNPAQGQQQTQNTSSLI